MNTPKFIDLFSGCGGLSLGLASAGLKGLFAIERDSMAFASFQNNLLSDRDVPVAKFDWPNWLEERAWPIDEFLETHRSNVMSLNGKVDVMGGAPPCQGFSFAGRRQANDPRNMLFEKYVNIVQHVEPQLIVLENVPGMRVAHTCTEGRVPKQSYYEKLLDQLGNIGYQVHGETVDASRFGVPQKRCRLIIIGARTDIADRLDGGVTRVFEHLERARLQQLAQFGLPGQVSAADAISDLLTENRSRIDCTDLRSPAGFQEVHYRGPTTTYQKLMHDGCDGPMDSMRLARHMDEVRARFKRVLEECARGVMINEEARRRLGIKKHRTHPMAASEPAPTITTLPDDILHYAEPRILTVRESARLQSFPDWFRFCGKFTTGGNLRTKECPRYTQVGNAVPPLLGRSIGLALRATLAEVAAGRQQLSSNSQRLIAA